MVVMPTRPDSAMIWRLNTACGREGGTCVRVRVRVHARVRACVAAGLCAARGGGAGAAAGTGLHTAWTASAWAGAPQQQQHAGFHRGTPLAPAHLLAHQRGRDLRKVEGAGGKRPES